MSVQDASGEFGRSSKWATPPARSRPHSWRSALASMPTARSSRRLLRRPCWPGACKAADSRRFPGDSRRDPTERLSITLMVQRALWTPRGIARSVHDLAALDQRRERRLQVTFEPSRLFQDVGEPWTRPRVPSSAAAQPVDPASRTSCSTRSGMTRLFVQQAVDTEEENPITPKNPDETPDLVIPPRHLPWRSAPTKTDVRCGRESWPADGRPNPDDRCAAV